MLKFELNGFFYPTNRASQVSRNASKITTNRICRCIWRQRNSIPWLSQPSRWRKYDRRHAQDDLSSNLCHKLTIQAYYHCQDGDALTMTAFSSFVSKSFFASISEIVVLIALRHSKNKSKASSGVNVSSGCIKGLR